MRRGLLGLAAVCAAALVATLAGAATLPGGTPISVSITAPGDNVTLPAAPFTVTGTASVGVGTAVADTTLIYIVDVSGSTSAGTGNPGHCPRQNVYDTLADTTLDCELLAVRDLNSAAIATGTVARIGFIGFGGTGTDTLLSITSAAALDLSPGTGVTTFTPPAANEFTPPAGMTPIPGFTPATNLDWVVQSAYLGGAATTPGLVGWPVKGGSDGFTLFGAHDVGANTNYYAALTALKNLLSSTTPTSKTVVAFLSDGLPTQTVAGHPLADALTALTTPGLKIYTFALGFSASCGSAVPSLDGSLAQISAHYATTCELRPDPSDAAGIVPAIIASQLTSVGLTVDGVAQSGVTITPVLPVTGPNSVAFTKSLDLPASLTPYVICATASGHDGAGIGNADPSCIHVTIQASPTVTVGPDGPDGTVGTVPEGSPFSIGGMVTGIGTTTTWSYSGGTGTCTFDPVGTVDTTVTCNDDGTYALTLTADDGINPPVSATEHLLVTNVAPTPTLTLTPTHLPLSSGQVAAHIAIADPGNDQFTCVIDWGDGSTDALPATGTSCDANHQYLAAGTFTVHVTVSDGDGGIGSTSGDVTVKGAPTLTLPGADPATGRIGEVNEGSAFAIPASVDGATSVSWTASGGTGTCTFTPSNAASTSVMCNDNGLYALTLSAVDEFGQTSSATVHLLVDNVAPTLIVTNPVAGASPRSVIFNGIVTDPGSHDVLTCHIDWGDGHSESVPVSGGFCNATHSYDATLAAATIHATASDDDGGVSAERIIPLTFNRPPICLAVRASDGSLWPPNHQMVLIQLSGATDPDTGDSVSYAITSVRQDEPLLGGGSGNFSPDAQRASGGGVYLRSERDGTGDGRVYTITYTVTDTHGASCTGTVTVGVPHDQAHDAQLTPGVSYNSFG